MSAGEQNQTAARGSSALTDGVRWQMNLAPLSDDQAAVLGLESGQQARVPLSKGDQEQLRPFGQRRVSPPGRPGRPEHHDPTRAQVAGETDGMKC